MSCTTLSSIYKNTLKTQFILSGEFSSHLWRGFWWKIEEELGNSHRIWNEFWFCFDWINIWFWVDCYKILRQIIWMDISRFWSKLFIIVYWITNSLLIVSYFITIKKFSDDTYFITQISPSGLWQILHGFFHSKRYGNFMRQRSYLHMK